MGRTRRHDVTPKHLAYAWGGSLLVTGLVAISVLAFTPLRTVIPGYGTEELKRNARLNAIRVNALQDSVAVQRHYIKRLQQLMTGRVDSVGARRTSEAPPSASNDVSGSPNREPAPGRDEFENRRRESREAHEQPAIAATSFPASTGEGTVGSSVVPRLSLPVEAPVNTGFPTRDFNANDSHFGVDIAVSEGTAVRAVGEGYVVLADWTQQGGYTIAVQHADGYLSVYKHNSRLLKQTGDHVQAREPLARSGNTGEVTTGPHLHFELWRHGLAQNPRPYVTGW